MPSILETLEEEFQAALPLTGKSVTRQYTFPDAQNVIKVAVGMKAVW